ncbi:MAG: transposase [Acidimicrobiia bacterium]|nr:transposase [Acidimicrobiia bacterium]
MKKLEGMGVEWFIAIPRYPNVKQAIEDINDSEWVEIGYTPDGVAQVAETTIVTKIDKTEHTVRLKYQTHPPHRPRTAAAVKKIGDITHSPPTTTCLRQRPTGRTATTPAWNRGIRDLKHHTGPGSLPIRAVLRQRRLDGRRGDRPQPIAGGSTTTPAKVPPNSSPTKNTVRNRLFKLPGRIVNHAGQLIVRLPTNWPWAPAYRTTLQNIRALPQLC